MRVMLKCKKCDSFLH